MTLRASLAALVERESHRPDHGRAWRCTIAFMAPLMLALAGRLPVEVTFAAVAAQSVALVDVRGAYALRLTLLLAMTGILACAASAGAFAGQTLVIALAATAVLAVTTGLWRHLSSDYGPGVAVSSSLLFFIAQNQHGGTAAAEHHLVAALIGGLWGTALQVALWPIGAQHPLRRSVSDAWLAAGELFGAISRAEPVPAEERHRRVAAGEAGLRAALDKTYGFLKSASPGAFVSRLSDLTRAGARLAMKVSALNTALETVLAEPAGAGLDQAFQPALTALGNTARTVAVAVVSRQPSHFTTAEVRLRRLTSLLRALQARVQAQVGATPAAAQLVEVLRQVEESLGPVGEALRATVDRAGERAAFSMELLDLQNLRLRPLASALNLSRRVDRTLLLFTARITFLTVAGVALVRLHPLPHGYWLPFTMVVVLQPDYGSTRQRAAQRLFGTLAGSVLASLTLWLRLPFAPLMAVTAAMSFAFGFLVKRNYGLAVAFVTLFVVLLTEAGGPVTLAITLERLGTTAAGGLLALLAAQLFWPVWERDRFPPFLIGALEANRDYLALILRRLEQGGGYDPEVVAAKRLAESANGAVFSSLQRMGGDPLARRDRLEQAAALANGTQRLTRVSNLLVLHLEAGSPLPSPAFGPFVAAATGALDAVAAAVGHPGAAQPRLGAATAAVDALRVPPSAGAASPRADWIHGQLSRASTELGAMLLAAREIPA
jgi:Fusaric acid resistance protein-like/FUSC-like inner membrane protein yccS